MAKIEQDAPTAEAYEILGTAIEDTLARLQLVVEQLRAAKSTLESSEASLAEAAESEAARADGDLDFVVAQMVSSRALSNLWAAAEPLTEALGVEEDGEEDEDDDEDEDDEDDEEEGTARRR